MIDPEVDSLTEAIESVVRARVGATTLQTDFRRSADGGADASVLIKGRIDNASGAAIAADFVSSSAISSARFAKQKLSLRFNDSFLVARIKCASLPELARGRAMAGRRVVIGFCDPNANKALHVGHLRNVAIGAAIAALWRAIGAQVECQSVVCDIGRNVAEALAGLLAAGGESVLSTPSPLAPRLGVFYAAYVDQARVATSGGAEPDAPIAREIVRQNDAADVLLDRWRDEDPTIRALWGATIARVLAEQAMTLARLGVRFDRILRESDAVPDAALLAEMLIARGLAFRDEDGAIVLETGRQEYARCPLTRLDGFPTEHLRALVLWNGLRDKLADADRIVHVMGHEWRTSTEIRLQALESLRKTGFPARYQMVSHRLVSVGGNDMKSSTGRVILLDDLYDAIDHTLRSEGYFGDADEAGTMRRVGVLAPMLEAAPEDKLDVSFDGLCDVWTNPGMRLARALAATCDPESETELTPRTRYLALQRERLARMLETAAVKAEPELVLRHLMRLAEERLSPQATSEGDALLRKLFLDGFGALGWRT